MTELSNKPETNPDIKTGNKKKVGFNNVEIRKITPTFGNTRNLYIPFKVPQNSHLKGLFLH